MTFMHSAVNAVLILVLRVSHREREREALYMTCVRWVLINACRRRRRVWPQPNMLIDAQHRHHRMTADEGVYGDA